MTCFSLVGCNVTWQLTDWHVTNSWITSREIHFLIQCTKKSFIVKHKSAHSNLADDDLSVVRHIHLCIIMVEQCNKQVFVTILIRQFSLSSFVECRNLMVKFSISNKSCERKIKLNEQKKELVLTKLYETEKPSHIKLKMLVMLLIVCWKFNLIKIAFPCTLT